MNLLIHQGFVVLSSLYTLAIFFPWKAKKEKGLDDLEAYQHFPITADNDDEALHQAKEATAGTGFEDSYGYLIHRTQDSVRIVSVKIKIFGQGYCRNGHYPGCFVESYFAKSEEEARAHFKDALRSSERKHRICIDAMFRGNATDCSFPGLWPGEPILQDKLPCATPAVQCGHAVSPPILFSEKEGRILAKETLELHDKLLGK